MPFGASAGAAMDAAVAESLYDSAVAVDVGELIPITSWSSVEVDPSRRRRGMRLPGGARVLELDVAADDALDPSNTHALLAAVGHVALRADSPNVVRPIAKTPNQLRLACGRVRRRSLIVKVTGAT